MGLNLFITFYFSIFNILAIILMKQYKLQYNLINLLQVVGRHDKVLSNNNAKHARAKKIPEVNNERLKVGTTPKDIELKIISHS